MNEADAELLHWTKSSASGSDNCVEVAVLSESVLVRDSKYPVGHVLSFTRAEWDAFVVGVRSGQAGLA
jgi:hypothetical protein